MATSPARPSSSSTTTTATRPRGIVSVVVLVVFAAASLAFNANSDRIGRIKDTIFSDFSAQAASSSIRVDNATATTTTTTAAARDPLEANASSSFRPSTSAAKKSDAVPAAPATSAAKGGSSPAKSSVVGSKGSFDDHDDEDGESFSACLLVMDENYRLVEWIAYHYFVMPLRYLVVAVDPHSETSPSKILDRWRDRIVIEEWTDSNFTSDDLMIKDGDTPNQKKGKHRTRQRLFYLECTRHLQKQRNRTFTSYHDVDEFIAINADVVGQSAAAELLRHPGSILRMVKKYRNNNYTAVPTNDLRYDGAPTNVEQESWYEHFQQSPCITIARALYGAVESTDEEVTADVPSFVDARQFDTLRYRYRTTKPRGTGDGLAKSIIDVSQLTLRDYLAGGGSAHRPLKSVCPSAWKKYNDLPLVCVCAFPRVTLDLFVDDGAPLTILLSLFRCLENLPGNTPLLGELGIVLGSGGCAQGHATDVRYLEGTVRAKRRRRRRRSPAVDFGIRPVRRRGKHFQVPFTRCRSSAFDRRQNR